MNDCSCNCCKVYGPAPVSYIDKIEAERRQKETKLWIEEAVKKIEASPEDYKIFKED